MKVWLRCVMLVAAAAALRPAVAADSAGNYAIWGAGARSCHQYRGVVDKADESRAFKDFLLGYLTAYNTLAPDTYNAVGGLSLVDALGWLDEYCRQHEMDSFERAIGQLLVAHHDQRMRVPPGANRGWGRSPSSVPEAGVQ